jgi:hypothetical protein
MASQNPLRNDRAEQASSSSFGLVLILAVRQRTKRLLEGQVASFAGLSSIVNALLRDGNSWIAQRQRIEHRNGRVIARCIVRKLRYAKPREILRDDRLFHAAEERQ